MIVTVDWKIKSTIEWNFVFVLFGRLVHNPYNFSVLAWHHFLVIERHEIKNDRKTTATLTVLSVKVRVRTDSFFFFNGNYERIVD